MAKENKRYKSYFWDKIFPIVLAGIISFAGGYYLKAWNGLNRLSSVAEDDKRQFRILVDKLDDLERKFAIALAKNDNVSASIIRVELKKTREKIMRLKEWGNIP